MLGTCWMPCEKRNGFEALRSCGSLPMQGQKRLATTSSTDRIGPFTDRVLIPWAVQARLCSVEPRTPAICVVAIFRSVIR